MKFEEFKNIVMAVREAYPNSNTMTTEEGINLWYRMLKDLEYRLVADALYNHIQNSRYAPAIADIRQACSQPQSATWTIEWMKLLNGARTVDLNEPGQYAFRLITRNCFESCLCNPEKLMQCMKLFESLYTQYDDLDERMKAEFKAITAPAPVPQIECEEEVGDDW